MLLNWAIYASLIQKRSHSYQSKHHMCFDGGFFDSGLL